VRLAGSPLGEQPTYEALLSVSSGWWYDARDLALVVRIPDQADTELELLYDPTITELRPPVEVPLQVTVPAGTPASPSIHVSTSANGWTQQPLSWDTPTTAIGVTEVPRGEWFYYKYTRGDWDTVEMWPGCASADNRYGFGAAHPTRDDVVQGWADWCF
jgi:alpha-glucosidase